VDILFIESLIKGKGTLTLTGNLGTGYERICNNRLEYKANAEAFD
jgi:hypothetical protein